jgi:hypothetical protein
MRERMRLMRCNKCGTGGDKCARDVMNAKWGMRLTRATNAKPSATNAKRGVQLTRVMNAKNRGCDERQTGCNKCGLRVQQMPQLQGATNASDER